MARATGRPIADVTARAYFTPGCEAGCVYLPNALPDDRRLLARILAGVAALALGQVAVLVLGKLDLLPGPIPWFLQAVVAASLVAATAVGYLDAGWLLAWLAAAVVVLPLAWVFALGGPPGIETTLLDVAVVALHLTVPYAVVAGTAAYLVGHGVRLAADRTQAT